MVSSDQENNLTHTKKLGSAEFEVFCKSQAETAHLIFSIEKYLKKFPSFYYNSILMINKGRSISTISKRLNQQFIKLTHEKSFYHTITNALLSRKKCIQKIKRQLIKAQRVLTLFKKQYIRQDDTHHLAYLQYVQKQGYSNIQVNQSIENSIKVISNIFIDMSRLRDMSIYVIETVHKWKIQIQEWIDRCNQYEVVNFIYQDQSVYNIIAEDTKFIWESVLGDYIFIDTFNDPFFVRNVLQVLERQQKTILEKYFVQILYPKSQQVVSKAVKAHEMLTFKYQPKIQNLYREEQLLIENYLSLKEKQDNQEAIQDIQQAKFQWEHKIKQSNDKLNSKGWVFGKSLKKTNTQKVKEIIQRHQQNITFIKPFNISNYAEKKSLALAFLAKPLVQTPLQKAIESKKQKQISKIYRTRSTHQIKRSPQVNKESTEIEKGYRSENQQQNKKNSRFYQSLSKLNPIILQDARQHIQETPKYKKKQINKIISQNILTDQQSDTKQFKSKFLSKKVNNQSSQNEQNFITPILLSKKLKLNTVNFQNDDNKQIEEQKASETIQQKQKYHNQESLNKSSQNIQIESQEKALNFEEFLQNFRPNTNLVSKEVQIGKSKTQQRRKRIENNKKKLLNVRQLIEKNRIQNQLLNSYKKPNVVFNIKGKSPYNSKLKSSPIKNHQKQAIRKSRFQNNKSLDKSFPDYEQVKFQKDASDQKQPFKFHDDFIILQSKSIPFDLVSTYLRHIFSQIHSTSKKFTLYSLDDLLKKLQDPYTHCIIFDVFTQKKGLIGQVILSEVLGINKQKLRYTIQFINIHIFELVVASILRIAEELLYATPCQQVLCPLIQDKLDPVSVHFVELIQNAFKIKVSSFGSLAVLQKKKLYYKESDLYQRLYIFSTNNKKAQEAKISKIMMGNYRSLKFECKCLMLSANFRMRSKTIAKSVISNYQSCSLGYLYRKVLQRIITRHHLRQMKVASVNPNQTDQTASLVKQNSFLRTSIQALAQYLKQSNQQSQENIQLTRFQNMSQVLTYLDYKQYSQYFHFSFLQESRFILNHQLFITELQLDLSIQFMVRSSIQFLILYNHHNLSIKVIEPNNNTKARGVLIPTTNDQIQLMLIDGHQYQQQTTDKLDLFSYLYIYQQNLQNRYKQITGVKQIVIPTIHKNNNNINMVRMFDGFFRLFPQRQFYSGNYFKCTNLWQSYFPTAVVYQPQLNSIVFEYPLIIGFRDKKHKQILTAFVIKGNNTAE